MAQYQVHQARRRPTVLDIMQWDGTIASAAAISSWVGDTGPKGTSGFRLSAPGLFSRLLSRLFGRRALAYEVYDVLHKSWITVIKGQWVLKGPAGEHYPIDERVLYNTYEFICHAHSPGE